MLLGTTTLAFCTHLNPSPQKYRESQKDAKFNGLIYIAANLLLKGTSGKFPFNVLSFPRICPQLTRGTLYPLNCPDQERIKSAHVHHSILANGVNEWERINAPFAMFLRIARPSKYCPYIYIFKLNCP